MGTNATQTAEFVTQKEARVVVDSPSKAVFDSATIEKGDVETFGPVDGGAKKVV